MKGTKIILCLSVFVLLSLFNGCCQICVNDRDYIIQRTIFYGMSKHLYENGILDLQDIFVERLDSFYVIPGYKHKEYDIDEKELRGKREKFDRLILFFESGKTYAESLTGKDFLFQHLSSSTIFLPDLSYATETHIPTDNKKLLIWRNDDGGCFQWYRVEPYQTEEQGTIIPKHKYSVSAIQRK